jgi:hypothetical protein
MGAPLQRLLLQKIVDSEISNHQICQLKRFVSSLEARRGDNIERSHEVLLVL